MKWRTLSALLCYIFICMAASCPAFGDERIDGIVFRGNEFDVDERTTLEIPAPDNEIFYNGYLKVAFDVNVTKNGDHFGYVCNVAFDGGPVVGLLLTNISHRHRLCIVNNNCGLVPLHADDDGYAIYDWNRIELELVYAADTLKVYEHGEKMMEIPRCALKGSRRMHIVFGKGIVNGLARVDIPPVELRDVEIWLTRSGPDFHYPLAKTDVSDSRITDEQQHMAARLVNYDWLADYHMHWKLRHRFSFPTKAYPVVDRREGYLYLVSGTKIVRIKLSRGKITTVNVANPIEMDNLSNQFIFIPPADTASSGSIYYYNFEEKAEPPISRFDMSQGRWTPDITGAPLQRYNWHNRFYLASDSVIVQMFGYGFHTYMNEFDRMTLDGSIRKSTLPDSVISPRYLSATGIRNGKVYVYGGIGNRSGDQRLGATVFHDLHTVDCATMKVTRVWGDDSVHSDEVVAQTLVIDRDGTHAKGLFFSPLRNASYIVLKDIDLADGSTVALGDTIPFQFHDMTSYADLIALSGVNELFAVTVHKDSRTKEYVVSIYSIKTPISLSTGSVESPSTGRSLRRIAGWGILLALVGMALWLSSHRRRRRTTISADGMASAEGVTDMERSTALPSAPAPDNTVPVRPDIPAETPGISLLGGFSVVDSAGVNITGRFTPTVRQLLILIILYTRKNATGVSNAQLKDTLWYDKSEESFSNNRSVNMRKLKVLLDDAGSFSLVKNQGCWSIVPADPAAVDYIAAMDLLRRAASDTASGDVRGMAVELIACASKGQLLPDMHFEYLDAFKSDYNDMMIDCLRSFVMRTGLEDYPDLRIKLADAILRFDSIDEEAVRLKCRLLLDSNKAGAAGKAFQQFVKEYKLLMNADFDTTFDRFVR